MKFLCPLLDLNESNNSAISRVLGIPTPGCQGDGNDRATKEHSHFGWFKFSSICSNE
ncbi:hypothetical protein ACTXT7_015716 [Hymenolepis weldensis]